MKTLALPALLLLSIFGAAASQAQVDPARIVATVNGEEIKGADYYHRMEYLGGVGKQFGQVFSELPPGLLTLDAMVTEKLVFQLSRDKGVYPSDLEVTKELEYRATKDATYLARWKESGKTNDDMRNEVRFDLAKYKLQTYGITIADGEIDAYYAAEPQRFTTPKRLKLRVIAVGTEDEKSAVDKELSAGTAFSAVAMKHSLDGSRASGGDYATVPVDALAPTMKNAVGTLKKGQVSPWIVTKSGGADAWLKFLVEDILPETKQKLDADTRRQVRKELALQRGVIKNDVRKELNEARRKAKIDIASPEFSEAYKRFIQQYLDSLGVGSAPATPPAPGAGN